MTVLDTNVVSEVLKPDPEGNVVAWLSAQQRSEVLITSITHAEVLYGVERLPEGKRKSSLANEIENLLIHEFQGRILPFDEDAARMYAPIMSSRLSIGRPVSQFDAMIAAITRSHNAVLATRNTKDFEHCGIRLINPWAG
jgi:predicted nucleic acid-binding protein